MNKLKITLLVLLSMGMIPILFISTSLFNPIGHPINSTIGILWGTFVIYFSIKKIRQIRKFHIGWILLILILIPQIGYLGWRFYGVPASIVAFEKRMDSFKQLEGKKLPEFEMIDMDGNPFSSDQLIGKKVIINLWATWCKPCVREIPHLNELYKKNIDNGLIVIGIGLESIERQKKFIDEHGLEYIFLKENDKNRKETFGYLAYPTNFFVNENGIIQTLMVGFSGEEELIKNAHDLLSLKSPEL